MALVKNLGISGKNKRIGSGLADGKTTVIELLYHQHWDQLL